MERETLAIRELGRVRETLRAPESALEECPETGIADVGMAEKGN